MSVSRPPRPPRASSRRSARLHAREEQRRREIRRRYVNYVIWAVVAIAVIALATFVLVKQAQAQPGQFKPNQGQEHIAKTVAHIAYNSRPPTSGPHWNIEGEAPVAWGIYETQIADEAQIHNLEHGGVIISYSCPGGAQGCPELVTQLKDFYNRYTTNPANRIPMFPSSTKLIVQPYDGLPNRIALTAWNRIDQFDNFDEDRIVKFIEAFRNKGPEATP